MRILLVEDDSRIARFVVKSLRKQTYAADVTADGDDERYKASISDLEYLARYSGRVRWANDI